MIYNVFHRFQIMLLISKIISVSKNFQIQRMFSKIIDNELQRKLEARLQTQPKAFTIQDFLDMSRQRSELYQVVRNEIPVRLARIITQLPSLIPGKVRDMRTG